MTRRLAIGTAIGLLLLLVLDALAARLGIVSGVVPRLDGTAAWTTSRAAGVTAFVALTLDATFGLLVSTGAGDGLVSRARAMEAHRWLSSVAVAMIAVHALVLVFDRFVRFDVIDALVPFSSAYRPLAVGLGVIAAYATLVVHVSFFLRRRIGGKAWRKLHQVSFAAFGAALVHGLAAGSGASSFAMRSLYAASLALVGGLSLFRVARAGKLATARTRR